MISYLDRFFFLSTFSIQHMGYIVKQGKRPCPLLIASPNNMLHKRHQRQLWEKVRLVECV